MVQDHDVIGGSHARMLMLGVDLGSVVRDVSWEGTRDSFGIARLVMAYHVGQDTWSPIKANRTMTLKRSPYDRRGTARVCAMTDGNPDRIEWCTAEVLPAGTITPTKIMQNSLCAICSQRIVVSLGTFLE